LTVPERTKSHIRFPKNFRGKYLRPLPSESCLPNLPGNEGRERKKREWMGSKNRRKNNVKKEEERRGGKKDRSEFVHRCGPMRHWFCCPVLSYV